MSYRSYLSYESYGFPWDQLHSEESRRQRCFQDIQAAH